MAHAPSATRRASLVYGFAEGFPAWVCSPTRQTPQVEQLFKTARQDIAPTQWLGITSIIPPQANPPKNPQHPKVFLTHLAYLRVNYPIKYTRHLRRPIR